MVQPLSELVERYEHHFCFDRRRDDAPSVDAIIQFLLTEKADTRRPSKGFIFFICDSVRGDFNSRFYPGITVGLNTPQVLYDLVDALFLTCTWCRYPGFDVPDQTWDFVSIDELFAGTPSQMDRNGRYYALLKSESVEGILNKLSEAEGRLLLECLSGISAFYWNSVYRTRSSSVSSTFRKYHGVLSKAHCSLKDLHVQRIEDQNLNQKIQALRMILAAKGIAVNS